MELKYVEICNRSQHISTLFNPSCRNGLLGTRGTIGSIVGNEYDQGGCLLMAANVHSRDNKVYVIKYMSVAISD